MLASADRKLFVIGHERVQLTLPVGTARHLDAGVPSQAGITVESMNERKLLTRLAHGAVTNVAFADLCCLAEGLGFELRRVSGSHHVFTHPAIPQLINLQAVGGQAKPYQVRQLMRLIERYDLKLRDSL